MVFSSLYGLSEKKNRFQIGLSTPSAISDTWCHPIPVGTGGSRSTKGSSRGSSPYTPFVITLPVTHSQCQIGLTHLPEWTPSTESSDSLYRGLGVGWRSYSPDGPLGCRTLETRWRRSWVSWSRTLRLPRPSLSHGCTEDPQNHVSGFVNGNTCILPLHRFRSDWKYSRPRTGSVGRGGPESKG